MKSGKFKLLVAVAVVLAEAAILAVVLVTKSGGLNGLTLAALVIPAAGYVVGEME